MAVSVETLIADTRLESGLRNNRVFSDDQIAGFLTNGFWALRDLMIAKFAYWFRAEYNFSLAGGVTGNVLELSEVPDLEMIQGLFLVGSAGNLQRVDMLSSISEIGYLSSTYPFADNYSFNGYVGRKYFPDGDKLFVYPAANASGNYRLIYTPQAQRLALPATRTFDVNSADNDPPSGSTDYGRWTFANGDFTSQDVGGTLTPTFATPNEDFNLDYTIVSVVNSTTINVTPDPSLIGSFTGPAAGTVSVEYQPSGTIGSLPVVLTPWQRYLVLYASIIIRQSRRQPMGDIELQFQQIEKRITALTKQRSEGVRQAPITRGWNGGFNGSGGFGY